MKHSINYLENLKPIICALALYLGACASDQGSSETGSQSAIKSSRNAQSTISRAGIVIRFSDGAVAGRCVEFTKAELTGQELLQAARPDVLTSTFNYGFGTAVCGIQSTAKGSQQQVGCFPTAPQASVELNTGAKSTTNIDIRQQLTKTPGSSPDSVSDACFCKPESWAYFNMGQGVWTEASEGYTTHRIKPGDIDGWSWTGYDASFKPVSVPPIYTLDELCRFGAGQDALALTIKSRLPIVHK